MALTKCGIFHTDIKSANIVFCKTILPSIFKAVLIDFGGSALNFKEIKICTREYFCNSTHRNEKILNQFQF